MTEDSRQLPRPSVTVQCIACEAKRSIVPGEIADDDVPMCQHCFMPMVAVSAHA